MYIFYCFHTEKKIVISDLPIEKIREQYGHRYEILNSVKDKDAIDIVQERLERSYPSFEFVDAKIKPKKPRKPRGPMSAETKRKMSEAHKGKKKSEETKRKTSMTMKGKSNFEGKKHTRASKRKIAMKTYGNQRVAGTTWINNPDTSKEKRIRDRINLPRGFMIGRDYYVVEEAIYRLTQKNRVRDEADDSW